MCPNSSSGGLVRDRGSWWRLSVSPAGSTLISFSVATHISALAFLPGTGACPPWQLLPALPGKWEGWSALGSVPWSVQSQAVLSGSRTATLCHQNRTQPPCHLWDAAWSPALLSQPLFLCSSPVTVLQPLTWPHRAAGEAARSGAGVGVSSLHRSCFRKWKCPGLSTSFPPRFPPIPCSPWGSAP